MLKRTIIVSGAVLSLATAGFFGLTYELEIRTWLFGPPEPVHNAVGPLGTEILRGLDQAQINMLTRAYGRVKVELDAARAKGYAVDALEPKMMVALDMARAKRYDQALTLLNRVEVSIPRAPEPIRTATVDEGWRPKEDIRPVPVKSKKRSKTRKKKKPVRSAQ